MCTSSKVTGGWDKGDLLGIQLYYDSQNENEVSLAMQMLCERKTARDEQHMPH